MTFWVTWSGWTESDRISVSILVLLEWPSEFDVIDVSGGTVVFQSLFYWNDLLSPRFANPTKSSSPMFQSLFYWNDLLSDDRAWRGRSADSLFQSLFYWNDLLSITSGTKSRTIFPGFNPCSIGMTFWVRSIYFHLYPHVIVSILVLLEWPSECCATSAFNTSIRRFNPCSIGMTFWVCLFWTSDFLQDFPFQSLFYWNDLLS